MSELVVGSIAGLAANSYVVDVASGSTLDLSAGAVFPAGSVIQVVSTTKTTQFSSTSTSFVDITDMSLSITPRSTSSKILVMVVLTGGHGSTSDSEFQILRDSTVIGSSTDATLNGIGQFAYNYSLQMFNIASNYLDSPSSTSALTYKVQGTCTSGGTFYINRRANDGYFGGVSSITLMEIAG